MTRAQVPWSRVAGRWLLGAPLWALLVVGPSGRWDWERGWAYVGLLTGCALLETLVLARWQPELLERRTRARVQGERWDRLVLGLMRLCTVVAYGLSGWQGARAGWPGAGPVLVGTAATLLGYGLLLASMAANPFFEATVRLQSDREQRVVAAGPYAVLRHPGYAGFALALLGGPVFLGSPLGLCVMGLAVALLVLRTALEDRFLTEQLPGYAAYRDQVRYRLVPGLW